MRTGTGSDRGTHMAVVVVRASVQVRLHHHGKRMGGGGVITYRRKLHLICDNAYYDNLQYNPNCHCELILDQSDAATKSKMMAKALQAGWIVEHGSGLCWCPSCAILLNKEKP